MPFFLDSTYLILVLPTVIFAMYAQSKVTSTFNKYAKIRNQKGYTGADIAKQLLQLQGVTDVRVEPVHGNLTDHYDPKTKTLRLSDSVYNSTSIAAVGVAAHETGHAMQHNKGYLFLNFRNSFWPVASIGSKLAMPLIILGMLFGAQGGGMGYTFVEIGILFFAATVVFSIVTLPVEFNASSRAIDLLDGYGFLTRTELEPAKKVLNAAALTYVASAAVAIANLLRLLIMFSGRRRD